MLPGLQEAVLITIGHRYVTGGVGNGSLRIAKGGKFLYDMYQYTYMYVMNTPKRPTNTGA